MMAIKLETLGERKFKIKLKPSTENNDGSKVQNSVLPGCNKRKHEPEVEEQPSKKWKMEPNVKRQCRGLLDALSAHKHGYVFNTPVDPVVLNIPDYFTVITHPMDLGTIKSKLTTNAYHSTQEFADDVKLTFSNAMLYNPPENQVHSMAKELECLFLKRWKLLEAKWNRGIVSAPRAYEDQKNGLDTGKTCSLNSVPLGLPKRISKPSMSVDEKRKLKKDLVEILVGRMSEELKTEFRKLGLEIPRKEIIDVEFNRFDEDVLWRLKRVVKEVKDSGSRNLSINENNKLNQFGATAKSGEVVSTSKPNDEKDNIKKALLAAHAAKMKKLSAASDSGKAQEDARLKTEARHLEEKKDARLKLEAQRVEERKARASLEASSKKKADEDSHLMFEELINLSGCYVSYDSCSGVVLRQRKTGKVVNPLPSIGLRLKKEFSANVSDDAANACVGCDMEEGEILE